jgi:1,4-dihydroxy-2-naphthoate octaprenyltransferase
VNSLVATGATSSLNSWILAARPKTLTAALVPIVGGTALTKALGFPILWWVSGLALLASLCIQVGTNLVNDAIDFKKGADTADRIGPQRVTQSGVFSYSTVMVMAGVCFFIAAVCGLPLVLQGGLPILLIGMVSILFGYAYTAGPFPLAYLGLGDLFVILFFGLVAVSGVVFLQNGSWPEEALVLGLQIGLHATVMIAINNLRDVKGDVLVGKKTLPVRFGKTFGRIEIAFLCLLPFVLNFYWLNKGFYWAAALPLLIFPLALRLCVLIFKNEPSPLYNQFLARGAGLHLIFGVLLACGLAWG